MTLEYSAAPDWFRAALAVPAQSHFIDIDGTELHYLAWNSTDIDKPPLLFVHGYRAHARWWSVIAPYFTERFRVYALDLSGMGDSGTRARYDTTVFAGDLVGVIDHIASEVDGALFTVIGHSFGGSTVVRACANRPGLIRHAIVIDSFFSFPDTDKVFEIPRLGASQIFSDYGDLFRRYRLLPPQPVAFPEILDYVTHHSIRRVETGWRWKLDPELPAVLADTDGSDLLSRTENRVDIVAGELSDVLSLKRARRIVRTLPLARGPVVIPRAHHHIMLDQPLALIGVLRALLA